MKHNVSELDQDKE